MSRSAPPPPRPKRPPLEVAVRIGGTAAMPAVLAQLGFDPAELLLEAGVDPALFGNLDNLIAFAQRGRLVRHCVARTGCTHLGLLIGQQAQLQHLGLLGELVQCAPDVATALATMVRYAPAQVRGAVPTLEVYGESVRLGYASYHAEAEATEQVSDGGVALLFQVMRGLCGPAWRPTEVLLARREPESREVFQQFFQAPLRFNAAHYALVFPARWLAHPLAAADAGLHGQLRRQADALAARYRGDVPDQVRRVLRMASTMAPMRPMGSTALHEVAAALSVHARTLGRRLNAAGTSFQALVDEDRFEQARQLLENSTVAVNEIAASLDYADASAFIRAFRRWTGTTPGDWRDTRAQARRRSVNRSSD